MNTPLQLNAPVRQRPITKWATDLLRREDVVVLDTETTGLGPQAEIIEIAVIALDGSVLFESFVKPSCAIEPEAMRVHGITEDLLADAPRFAEVYARLHAVLHDKLVLIYNAEFDTGRLSYMAQRAGLPPLVQRAQCLMNRYATFYGQRGSYGSYRWQSLSAACKQQGIVLPADLPQHRALGDALTTLALLRHLASFVLPELEQEASDAAHAQ